MYHFFTSKRLKTGFVLLWIVAFGINISFDVYDEATPPEREETNYI